MIYEQKLVAVNPVQLAIASGVTKIAPRRMARPPVVQPHLLTAQLRGCNCGCAPSMGGKRTSGSFDPFWGTPMLGLPPDWGMPSTMGRLGQDPNSFDTSDLGVPSAVSGAASSAMSILQQIQNGAQFIPGVGQVAAQTISTVTSMVSEMEAWFGIGAGRTEANLIVPTQNQLMQALGQITNDILTGQNPGVTMLQSYYRQVWIYGVTFQEFVLQNNFTDRRASGQALNGVMPYIDGSCGYSVPVGPTATPAKFNCLTWGSGTIGGPGTTGMLGAIGRAIVAQGGGVPALPDLHQTANTGLQPTAVVSSSTGLLGTSASVSTPLAIAAVIALLFYAKVI